MAEAVIVAGARTPIGKLSGALGRLHAPWTWAGSPSQRRLERAGVSPDQVDYVLMGQVIQAGQGQITARQAAVKGGIPMTVPANTINKVCLSGLNTIYLADQMIRAGDAEIVVAGGMESMTQAPYLLPGARAGLPHRRRDAGRLHDVRRPDCAFDHIAWASRPSSYNAKVGISRERQDALRGRQPRAGRGRGQGRPVGRRDRRRCRCPQRKGDPLLVDTDEGVRPGTTAESLGALRPAFTRTAPSPPERLADLRRRRRGHRDVGGQGRGARHRRRSASWSATAWSPAPTPRC